MEEMKTFDLIDIWRVGNNDHKQFTWSTDNFRKRARLDFFLVSNCLTEEVLDTNINSGYQNDHSMICLTLCKGRIKRGKGLWKFNNSLLKDKNYAKMVKTSIKECLDLYAALPYERKNIENIPREDIHLHIPTSLFLDTL